MFSLSRGNNVIECNGAVSNSAIDMNGGVITNHAEPSNGTDVVNKNYVDSSIPPVSVFSLNGTSLSLLVQLESGSVMIVVKNIIYNGPAATFLASKSESHREPSISRFTSSSGMNTQEKLVLTWNPGEGINIRKTGINYDGEYRAKIILI